MIFDNNSTALGSIDIPVVEGYDCSTGAARALIESARNDYAMFNAMLKVDFREAHIERAGADNYVTEGELTSLTEATANGIWQKIKDLFKSLIAKIKSIFTNFIARISSLFMKDAALVKKYKKQLSEKYADLGKMEIKYAKSKSKGPLDFEIGNAAKLDSLPGEGKEKDKDMDAFFNSINGVSDVEGKTEFAEKFHESFFEDTETMKLSESGVDISSIMSYLEGYNKAITALKTKVNKFERDTKKLVSDADSKALKTAGKIGKKNDDGTEVTADDAATASATYSKALAYQEATTWVHKCLLNEIAFDHKQKKAVFMKAVTINPKKLKESADYAEVMAEAAAQEVDDVINSALSTEQITKNINIASKNVLDDGVSNDYFANEYDKCSAYSDDPDDGHVDGSVKTCYDSKHESYDFGSLLY